MSNSNAPEGNPPILPLWAEAMRRSGYIDPHTGQPAIRKLCREVGLHPKTVTRIAGGFINPLSTGTEILATHLNVDMQEVFKLYGMSYSIDDLPEPEPQP